MSQQTIQSTSQTEATSAISSEQKAFPKIVPSPQMATERTATSKKTITTSIDRGIAFWRALPPERRRSIALLGLSVYLSVAVSLIVTLIAQLVNRKPEAEE